MLCWVSNLLFNPSDYVYYCKTKMPENGRGEGGGGVSFLCQTWQGSPPMLQICDFDLIREF